MYFFTLLHRNSRNNVGLFTVVGRLAKMIRPNIAAPCLARILENTSMVTTDYPKSQQAAGIVSLCTDSVVHFSSCQVQKCPLHQHNTSIRMNKKKNSTERSKQSFEILLILIKKTRMKISQIWKQPIIFSSTEWQFIPIYSCLFAFTFEPRSLP